MTMSLYQQFRLFISRLKTPKPLYYLHRKLFFLTNGRWNEFVTGTLKFINPKDIRISNCNSQYSNIPPSSIAKQIAEKGYFQFEKRVNPDIVDKIVNFSLHEPGRAIVAGPNQAFTLSSKISFASSEDIQSPRLDIDQVDILKSRELVDLIFDKSFCNIAQEYFGSRPVLDLIALWWSKPCNDLTLQNQSAQMFHFDMDRIKFLKFFLYLTDVTPQNGPHCYVEKSHRNLPTELRRDGRFKDEEIIRSFGKDSVLELCAPKGTLFAIDTRGLHKGIPLESGNRLIFQIEFANSMFGQSYPQLKIESNESNQSILEKISEFPLVYAPMFDPK